MTYIERPILDETVEHFEGLIEKIKASKLDNSNKLVLGAPKPDSSPLLKTYKTVLFHLTHYYHDLQLLGSHMAPRYKEVGQRTIHELLKSIEALFKFKLNDDYSIIASIAKDCSDFFNSFASHSPVAKSIPSPPAISFALTIPDTLLIRAIKDNLKPTASKKIQAFILANKK